MNATTTTTGRIDALEAWICDIRDEARALLPHLAPADRDAAVLRHIGNTMDDLTYELALIRERRPWREVTR